MAKQAQDISPLPTKAQALIAPLDMESEAGAGFEEARSKDSFAVPFLMMLQPLSPFVQLGDAQFVKGAAPGMIMHSITHELYPFVTVIPVHYTRTFVEWVPRDKGGGFRGEFKEQEKEEEFKRHFDRETGKALLDSGNQLADTRNHYVMLLRPDGGLEPALISLGSSQIKKSRAWMTMMRNIVAQGARGLYNPPMYSNSYRLTPTLQKNAKGQWYGWAIERLGYLDNTAQVDTAKAFRNQVTAGAIVADRSATDATEGLVPDDNDTI